MNILGTFSTSNKPNPCYTSNQWLAKWKGWGRGQATKKGRPGHQTWHAYWRRTSNKIVLKVNDSGEEGHPNKEADLGISCKSRSWYSHPKDGTEQMGRPRDKCLDFCMFARRNQDKDTDLIRDCWLWSVQPWSLKLIGTVRHDGSGDDDDYVDDNDDPHPFARHCFEKNHILCICYIPQLNNKSPFSFIQQKTRPLCVHLTKIQWPRALCLTVPCQFYSERLCFIKQLLEQHTRSKQLLEYNKLRANNCPRQCCH